MASNPSRSSRDGSLHVALLVDTATGWGRGIIRGVMRYSEKHGPWHLAVHASGQTPRQVLPYGWKGHGVIARVGSPAMVQDLVATGLPVVNTSAIELPSNPFARVISDYDAIAKMSVEFFRSRGFRQFAYSGLEDVAYGKRHRDAFCNACENAGHTCDVMPQIRRRGKAALQQRLDDAIAWLKSLTTPVAVFTFSCSQGRDILEACRLANLASPYEVSVLSGDNDDLLCEASTPKLSGVLVSAEQLGHSAAHKLDLLMHGQTLDSDVELIPPTGIRERPSTDSLAIDDPDVVLALEFVGANACSSIQVADILRAVPASRRSIERKFAELLGRTPAEEIRRIRMARAKNLLAETDMPMQAIANACGYGTYNYLTRVFSSEFGITPREYRKKTQAR